MIDHISIAVRDLERAARFYEMVLGAIGYAKLEVRPHTIGFGKKYSEFWLNLRRTMTPLDPDCGAHVGLRVRSMELVDAFHAAALAAGGLLVDAGDPREGGVGAVAVAPVGVALGNLECVIGLNRIAARETLVNLNLQRIVLIRRATALILDALRPPELLEVGPTRIEVGARIAWVPGSLVEINGIAIAYEGVAAAVADVPGGNRQVFAKLVLDSSVVHHD